MVEQPGSSARPVGARPAGLPVGFLCYAAGLAGASWTGITLAEFECFGALKALGGGAILAALTAVALGGAPRERESGSAWIAALALALCTTLLPVIDTTLLSQDASLHRASGRWLAETSTLRVEDPTMEATRGDDRAALLAMGSITNWRTSLVRLPGGLVLPDLEGNGAYPSFSHLLSVWIAIAYELAGESGIASLSLLFAFSAWWAIGLIAHRDGGAWGAFAALALLSSWLPEHWFARFQMPEILGQALVWGGVAAARFSFAAAGLDLRGRQGQEAPQKGAVVAGAIAGLLLGMSTFARLEQFWIFVPFLFAVRAFLPPERRVFPPGALLAFALTAGHGLFHLLWIPTDYGNRIYRSAFEVWRSSVFALARLVGNDGYILGFILTWVLPGVIVALMAGLLGRGWVLARRRPGSFWRPLVLVIAIGWLGLLYSRGLPEGFSLFDGLAWYVPWPVWAVIVLGLPSSLIVSPIELVLLLEAVDQVVWGRVTAEHVWASRRLVVIVLPLVALAAARASSVPDRRGPRRVVLRTLVVIGILLGAAGLRGIAGAPLQSGAADFVAEIAEEIEPDGVVLVSRPLDWVHVAAGLWLGHGRVTLVQREEGISGYDAILERHLRAQQGAPLYLLSGAVVEEGGEEAAIAAGLDRVPAGFSAERISTHFWEAPALEVTRDRRPGAVSVRRTVAALFRLTQQSGGRP